MASYAVKDRVRVQIGENIAVGELIDIDLFKRQFKLRTETGSHWIRQDQIISKI